MSIVLLTSIILTTLVYSAFGTKLQIDGDLIVRSNNDIRVTNISIKETMGSAYETYNNKYTKNTTSMFVTLPSNSSITYEVEITNDSNTEYKINTLEELTNSNSNITIETLLTNKTIFESNTASKYIITLSNNTSNEENISLVYKYNFVINNYYEEAEEKFTLLKNNVSGYEGVYYFDENGDLDYGDGTKISLNMTSDIPKGVVSIWNNQAIYVCLNYGEYNYEYDTTNKKLEIREMPCLTDRYQNLVINGDLSYKSNYNLTMFGDYDDEGYLVYNSSKKKNLYSTDYIPVDMNKQYSFSIDAKTSDVNAIYYIGYIMYDTDRNNIDQFLVHYKENTLTELIEDLKPGDTVVYLKDLSNWNGSNYTFNGLLFWNKVDSTGYEYQPLTYGFSSYQVFSNSEQLDKTNNTITLDNAWPSRYGLITKGTKVSQHSNGCGAYHYFYTGKSLTTDFITYSYDNINNANNSECQKFRTPTKFIRFLIITNDDSLSNVNTYIKNISIKEIK